MKTAAKVLIIIGMILRCIIPILGMPALAVGISAIKKLGAVRDIGTIRKWGVAVLLLAGLVAGVIMLVMKEDDLYDSPEEAAAAAALKRRQAMPDRNNTNQVQRRRFPPEPRHSPC